ncbi:hypothetical protein BH10ACI1_BH10ACI1_10130 [soil metagenome]
MQFKLIFLIIISIFLTACPNSEQTNANVSNANAVNTANVTTNTNSPFNTTRTPEAATTNNAPTLAPVVAAYYVALKKKDDAAIRKVLSADFIKTLEADMKDEGKKSLAAYIAEIDKVPEKPVEVRNEKIDGDKATAELKGGFNANWTTYIFRKENGEWKMTNEFKDVNDVKNSVNSNSSTNSTK